VADAMYSSCNFVRTGGGAALERTPNRIWLIALPYLVLLGGSAAIVNWGLTHQEGSASATMLIGAGTVAFFFAASLLPVVLIQASHRRADRLQLLKSTEQLAELLAHIHEHTMLSDSAKRIAYRREERQMLRKAIEEDIALEDWDAATVLTDNMSERFGYIEEAEEFRRHIDERRADVMYRRMRESVEHCEALIAASEWTAAYAEAARIRRMFPDAPQAQEIDEQVRRAWRERKQQLEREFLEIAGQSDAEGALEILKELDLYLTPREAEPYKEIARGVIGKARDNLGLQFKLAVQAQDWSHAIHIGERIMDEFPNSLMAREVRERIGVIRVRAAETSSQPSPARIPLASAAELSEATAPPNES